MRYKESNVKLGANSETELKAQLKVALQNQKAALKRFGELMRDVESGRHSDGSERILRASRKVTAAHESILAVLLKMNKAFQGASGKKNRP